MIQAAPPTAAPTTAATTPTDAPLATIDSRRWRSVAPIAESIPSWGSRRWAITVKLAEATSATSSSRIEQASSIRYAEARRALQSGDLLFCAGEYPVSKIIRRVTDSPWSHVGLIFRVPLNDVQGDRVLLLESVEPQGVRFAPLSKYVRDYEKGKPYQGKLAIARQADVHLDTIDAHRERFSKSG